MTIKYMCLLSKQTASASETESKLKYVTKDTPERATLPDGGLAKWKSPAIYKSYFSTDI